MLQSSLILQKFRENIASMLLMMWLIFG